MSRRSRERFVAPVALIIPIALAVVTTTAACDSGPSSIVSLTSITPNVGPAGTATEIRIKGMGFKAGATVTLGAPATDVSVIDSETIVAKTPLFAGGIVGVNVRNPDGGTDTLPGAFQFVGVAPVNVFSVSPNKGGAGFSVTVLGNGFKPGVTVSFSGVPATSVTFNSNVKLFARVPMLPGGTADVTVTNPGGESFTLPGSFTFQVVTFSASAGPVTAGATLSVSWESPFWYPPEGFPGEDWIGLFPSGAPSVTSPAVWSIVVPSATGTLNLPAPMSPGQYEFRYISANTVQAVVSVVVTGGAH